MTERRFEGKSVLISGGASGIGLATAKRMIADGATVWISDIQDELGESVAEEIGATYVHLDVVNESEWISVVELIASQGQGLHFVMNNAGIAVNGNLETETTDGQTHDGPAVVGHGQGTRSSLGLGSHGGSTVG